MSGVQLLFTLLQLAFLLLDLLLEDHLHLCFHLSQFLLVQGALLLLLHCWIDLLEDARILRDAHLRELVRTVILVQSVVRVLLEFFHVCTDEHLTELDEIAVLLIVHFDDTPRIATASDLATFRAGDLAIGTHYGEWNLGHNLLVFGNGLLVIEFISRALEYLDRVVVDIRQDLAAISERTQRKQREGIPFV